MDTDLRHRTIATNGVNLHVVEAGGVRIRGS